jgi:hypothetical protein
MEPEPMKAAAGLSSSRGTGTEVERWLPDNDEATSLAGVEEVEAPPLTMIEPGVKKRQRMEESTSPSASSPSASSAPARKKVTKGWKFWKRPSKREMELAELRRGCAQITGVMGAVQEQLETANNDRDLLRKTLSPLPLAVDGLRRVGDNQRRTHEILEGLQECVNRTAEKDAVFFKAMDRLNDGVSTMDMVVVGMGRTFSSIERNSKASTATLEKLAARIDASDRFMESAFDHLKKTEKQFTNYVDANARRSALVTVTICGLMTLGITMLAYTLSHNPTEMPAIPGEEAGAVMMEGGALSANELEAE